MRHLLTCFALGLLLTSCDGPAARFDTFAVTRPINLARQLGSEVTLLGLQDTLQLRLNFDPGSGTTLVTRAQDSTVVLEARIFARRGLYYAVEDLKSGCWVHALRIGKGQVQGLATGYKQMEDLSTLVQHGSFPELVRYRSLSDDSIRLRFEARPLRRFYLAELDSFPTYRLAPASSAVAAAKATAATAEPDRPSLYPNPAATTTTLRCATAAPRTVRVYNHTGQLVHTVAALEAYTTIPVQDLPAGTYVVRVTQPAQPAYTTRLLVQH
ncbi:T9SS type A sorting domain-containing protein [Hymenobacter chitinivorans]|uniref:Putative secreted protein (Por secretion system target) n=1 Tax=Hymenobacter chitinivorans DSM 11115 TaxID=1121954 RepID=A0A2M9BNX8_9BACT|nr:T9SS type A sorting domain-containing protein [Hymenobacter chitinivorans]PJJ59642.1 putative secreted protein (Por secretion system target) [Hymenobacter chitinivorans DSM 11115]